MCKKIIAFVLIIVSLSIHAQKGYEIQVTIRGLKDTTLVLGHHFGSSIYPDDTTKLDGNGRGVFKKKKDLPGGMYVIYLPNKTYFDIIVNNEIKFSVENDTIDLFKNIKFKNSKENELFYSYQNFLAAQRSEMQKLSEKYKASKDDKEKEDIRKQIEVTDKKVAIIGSGPAGLSAATYLLRSGIAVTMYERSDRAGGLLTYGIPGFKLDKKIVDCRVGFLVEAGLKIVFNCEVGKDAEFDVISDTLFICSGMLGGEEVTNRGDSTDFSIPSLTAFITAL